MHECDECGATFTSEAAARECARLDLDDGVYGTVHLDGTDPWTWPSGR